MTRERKTELRVPSPEDIERLLRCFSTAPTSVRNRALVGLLWRCGLRISEALALTPGDIDAKRGRLVVKRGKGSKSRTVGLDAGASALVKNFEFFIIVTPFKRCFKKDAIFAEPVANFAISPVCVGHPVKYIQ
jgi:integrase